MLAGLFACRLRQGQPAKDVQIHLRKWDFDAGGLYCIERRKVKVAVHFTASGLVGIAQEEKIRIDTVVAVPTKRTEGTQKSITTGSQAAMQQKALVQPQEPP